MSFTLAIQNKVEIIALILFILHMPLCTRIRKVIYLENVTLEYSLCTVQMVQNAQEMGNVWDALLGFYEYIHFLLSVLLLGFISRNKVIVYSPVMEQK